MELFDVKVEERIVSSKSAVKKLKDEGLIPGIIYNGAENIPISVEEHQLNYIINKHGRDVFLNVHFNGMPIKVKIQELQRDPVNQDIQHIDLIPVDGNILH
jgi:large subunit ribosomal protein L25